MNLATDAAASTRGLESLAASFAAARLAEIRSRQMALPGWSRLAEQVRAALADPQCPVEQLTRLTGADAGLAMLVLRAANSTLLARSGKPLIDLRLALQRLSRHSVRSVAFSWALAQVRQAPRLSGARAELAQLWHEAIAVATCSRLIAVRSAQLDPDQALLTGLLHNVGKLYLSCHLAGAELPLSDAALREQLLSLWHVDIGRTLLEAWQLPEAIVASVAAQDAADGCNSRDAAVAVLATAVIAARAPDPLQDTAEHLASFAPFGFGAAQWLELLKRGLAETAMLKATLTD